MDHNHIRHVLDGRIFLCNLTFGVLELISSLQFHYMVTGPFTNSMFDALLQVLVILQYHLN